jgi:molecular chaperone GrpE
MKNKKVEQDDIVFESDDESVEIDFVQKIKKIKEDLKKCQEEKAEYLDGWQRAKADFINYKKTQEENLHNHRKYANEDLTVSIFPVLDAFEMSLKDHGEGEEIKRWKTGFEHVYKQLKKILESVGVEQLNPEGETFDPNLHESIEMIETDKKDKDHKIAKVVMRGYKLGDKILRAPQVKVWVCKTE